MASRLRGLIFVALPTTVLQLGCVQEDDVRAPAAECRELGVQCALPDGPLGVCESRPCAPDEAGPCFVCAPQH